MHAGLTGPDAGHGGFLIEKAQPKGLKNGRYSKK